jgi:enoyl-CoA hydratase
MAVHIEKNGPVTTVIIDRPEAMNAINRPTADLLNAAFRAFEADDDARVAVLCGANGTFCAGVDLKSLADATESPYDITEEGDGPLGITRMWVNKPVIAAVSGYALAGGFEVALWADLRVVEEDAVFGVFNRRWGIPLIDGGTVRLPRIVGQGRALDIILTGRPVKADEAFEIGLANRLVAKGEARRVAEELAADIARFPPVCVRTDRKSTYDQFGLDLQPALDLEMRLGWKAINAGEAQMGARRFTAGKGRHGSFKDI